VTYVAREADLIGSSSLRNMADVALFTERASSCHCTALRARQADPGETRSSALSTSVTEILTRFARGELSYPEPSIVHDQNPPRVRRDGTALQIERWDVSRVLNGYKGVDKLCRCVTSVCSSDWQDQRSTPIEQVRGYTRSAQVLDRESNLF
jgi:hypothetical protein